MPELGGWFLESDNFIPARPAEDAGAHRAAVVLHPVLRHLAGHSGQAHGRHCHGALGWAAVRIAVARPSPDSIDAVPEHPVSLVAVRVLRGLRVARLSGYAACHGACIRDGAASGGSLFHVLHHAVALQRRTPGRLALAGVCNIAGRDGHHRRDSFWRWQRADDVDEFSHSPSLYGGVRTGSGADSNERISRRSGESDVSMMRRLTTAFVLSLASASALAAGGGYEPVSAGVDWSDQASLQRGAKLFVNHCLSCHSAGYMRYNRLGEDLGLSDDQVRDNLMFASDKTGELMHVAMGGADAERWFGVVPPDLTVISRARGPDWLYTYLMTFYRDESRPLGVNNLMFDSVGMPHVFERLQGIQQLKTFKEGEPVPSNPLKALELVESGTRSAGQFSKDMRDLVNYLNYMGEPAQLERYGLGVKVFFFLVVLTFLTRALYKEYWKDVH